MASLQNLWITKEYLRKPAEKQKRRSNLEGLSTKLSYPTKILFMQSTTERGRLLEVATKLYLEKQGFTFYLWQEWVSQRGLFLQDTGIDLVAEKDGELYAVQCKTWSEDVNFSGS